HPAHPQQAAPPQASVPPPPAPAPEPGAPEFFEDEEIDLSNLPPDDIDMGQEADAVAASQTAPQASAGAAAPAAEAAPAPGNLPDDAAAAGDDGLAWLPPLGDGADSDGLAAAKANPSLAELEEELFPVEAPEGTPDDLFPPEESPPPPGEALPDDNRDEVLAHGGFLPGA
ncbi:MAG: hypothetical protein K2N62_00800, partial [Desulfovibrio sp.]|nr:hypothetical protein [Desulfovibrio sp.]